MNKLYSLCCFLIVLVLLSCQSPQKMYNNGNYSGALYQLNKKIRKGKAKREDVALAQRSMDKLDQESLDEIQELRESDNPDKWGKALKNYDRLIEKHEDFARLVKFDSDRVAELKVEKESLQQDIIDYHMSEGYELIAASYEEDNKFFARESHIHFEEAKKYGADYEDLDSLIKTSYLRSVLYYAVDVNNRNFGFNRMRDIEDISTKYLEVEETAFCKDCDCEIEIDISRIYHDERTNDFTRTYTDRIQDGYTTETDTSGNKVQVPKYVNISADLTTIEIQRESLMRIDMNVYERSKSCNIREDRYEIGLLSEGVAYNVNGDERAIPANINLRGERLPDEREIEEELYEELYDRLEDDLRARRR